MQPPSLTGHHSSALFDSPHIDMCSFEPSKIRTPPHTGQLTVVPMVSAMQCTGFTMYMVDTYSVVAIYTVCMFMCLYKMYSDCMHLRI